MVDHLVAVALQVHVPRVRGKHRLRPDEDLRHARVEQRGHGGERGRPQPGSEHHQRPSAAEVVAQACIEVDTRLTEAAEVGLEQVERVRALAAPGRLFGGLELAQVELRPRAPPLDAVLAREARGARDRAVAGDETLHARRSLQAVDVLRVPAQQLAALLECPHEAVRAAGRVDAREQAPRHEAEGERVGDKIVGVEEREGIGQ